MTVNHKIKAVIFDMDGVIVDSEPFYTEVEKENFRRAGLNISREEHLTFQGTATDRMWTILREKYNLSETVEELVAMTNSLVTPYFASLPEIVPMPGVENIIAELASAGFPLAVASSSYPDVIQMVLEKTGLKPYFHVVVDSQMAGSSKPDPDIFLLAAQKLRVNPDECLVIEDSTNGIRAAKAAGMTCVAFAGPGSEHQDQSEADSIIKDFSELTDLISKYTI